MDKKKKTNPSSRRQTQSIHSNYANKNNTESKSRGYRPKQNSSRSVLDDENSNDLAYCTEKSLLLEKNLQTDSSSSSESSENQERSRPANEKTISRSKEKKTNRYKTPLRVKEPLSDTNKKSSHSESNRRDTHQEDPSTENEQDSNALKSSRSDINLVNIHQVDPSNDIPPDPNKNPSQPKKNKKSFHHVNYGPFRIVLINGDGNCLFRCMAHYVFGNDEDHILVRHMVVDHVCNKWDYYNSFAPDEDVEKYSQRMLEDGVYGNEMEISSFVEVFNCKVEVFFMATPRRDPLVFGTHGTLCYFLFSGENDRGHYDVLRPLDPDDLQDHTDAVISLKKQVADCIENVWNEDVEEEGSNGTRRFMRFEEIIVYLKDLVTKNPSQEEN